MLCSIEHSILKLFDGIISLTSRVHNFHKTLEITVEKPISCKIIFSATGMN